MRVFYSIVLLVFVIIFSCNLINGNVNTSKVFINKNNDSLFDLSNESIYKQAFTFDSLKFCKVDSILKIQVVNITANYDELYYYSEIFSTKDAIVLLGSSDYYSDFILVSFSNNKELKDARIISSALGDGGDFYYKSSFVKNKELISNFKEGHSTLTTPIDTTHYRIIGKSRIFINDFSKIKEDTILVSKDSIII